MMLSAEPMRVLTLASLAVALLVSPSAWADDRSFRLTASIGPTLFALDTQLLSPGVLLDLDATAPVGESGIFGLRLAWGLTEFRRTVEFARAGYELGRWTAHAYEDVVNWAGEDSKDQGGRILLSIFPMMFLIVPFALAGSLYMLAPFAASTYVELDAAGGLDLSRGGVGPYFKGGLGFLGYLHPTSNRLYGGIGPTAAVGFKIERFDVGIKGTWVPGVFQGDVAHQNLFTAGLSFGLAL